MARLRLIKSTPPRALAYTNRRGDTYYLHERRTKTGKPGYFFAKTVRAGALAELPRGYEVSESINGVVSVRRRRSGRPQVSDADVEVVRAAVRELPRLPLGSGDLRRVAKKFVRHLGTDEFFNLM